MGEKGGSSKRKVRDRRQALIRYVPSFLYYVDRRAGGKKSIVCCTLLKETLGPGGMDGDGWGTRELECVGKKKRSREGT